MSRRQRAGEREGRDTTACGEAWTGDTFEGRYKEELLPEVMEYLFENREHRNLWKGVPDFQRR